MCEKIKELVPKFNEKYLKDTYLLDLYNTIGNDGFKEISAEEVKILRTFFKKGSDVDLSCSMASSHPLFKSAGNLSHIFVRFYLWKDKVVMYLEHPDKTKSDKKLITFSDMFLYDCFKGTEIIHWLAHRSSFETQIQKAINKDLDFKKSFCQRISDRSFLLIKQYAFNLDTINSEEYQEMLSELTVLAALSRKINDIPQG